MHSFFKNKWLLASLITIPTFSSGLYLICSQNNKTQLILKQADERKRIFDNKQKSVSRDVNKINLLQFIPTINNYYVNSFYSDNQMLTWLKNQIISNPTYIFPDWNNDTTNVINEITINTNNDTNLSQYGDIQLSQKEVKNINGKLWIDVSHSYLNSQNDLVTVTDTFILCGFKRDQASLFINSSTKSNGWMIYNSIQNNIQLKLENNNHIDRMSFVLSNVFYYENYSDPILSNFTFIPSYALIENDYNIKISKPLQSDSTMFIPQIMLQSNSSSNVVEEVFGVVKFSKPAESILNNPIGLAIIIGISLIGFLLIVILIVKYLTKGTRIK